MEIIQKFLISIEVGKMKKPYKKLLHRARRENDITKEQQDSMIDKFIEELFNKVLSENPNFSEEKSVLFYNTLKKRILKWNIEFDKEIKNRKE